MSDRKGSPIKRDLPKYVYRHKDRYGTERFYFRPPNGGSTRLPDDRSSAVFETAYVTAVRLIAAETKAPTKIIQPTQQHTLRWLWLEYERSREFRALEKSTQRVRHLIIEKCLAEPINAGATEVFGDCPINKLTAKAIKVLRDRKAEFPNAANGRLKAIRQMLS